MAPSPSIARELVAHSQALRRLARDLVGSSDADDLVQDTAVRALRSPPAVPDGLFAWLGTVMRRLAANRRRGDLRRRRREAANGPAASGPAADEEPARCDLARAVSEAVFSLPEPYQTALVQRYFQDLSPAAIAARTAVPLATVKSRLQRGLEHLRATLARRDGRDWRLALVPAIGLPGRGQWLWPFSVSLMSTSGKVIVVVAASALAALALWMPRTEPPPPAIAADAVTGSVAAVAAAGPTLLPAREAVGVEESVGLAELAQPFAFELHCRVVDDSGLAIGGAKVAIAPRACALATWPVATDNDGRVVLAWRARARRLVMTVGLEHGGSRTSLQRLEVAAGEPAHVHFVAGQSPLPASVHVDESGRQVVSMPDCSQGRTDCMACHDTWKGADLFGACADVRAGLHPDALFGERGQPLMLGLHVNSAGPEMEIEFTDSVATGTNEARRPQRHISGRVFGADGRPVPGARLEIHRPDFFGGGTRTRPDGSFRFAWPVPGDGRVWVRAGGGPEGLATMVLDVGDDLPIHGDLHLQTGRVLRGRAVGTAGQALSGARVEYVAAPGQDGDVATVGPDGAFAFANLPPGPGHLLLWGVRGERLPIAELGPVLADGSDVLFDLRTAAPVDGSLRLVVQSHDGGEAVDAEVFVWQLATRRGSVVERGKDGAFHTHGLAAGFYRIEVTALGGGVHDLGEHWLDGRGLVELAPFTFPAPAKLVVEHDGLEVLELLQPRADIDVRAHLVSGFRGTVLLPAGPWLVLAKGVGDGVRRAEVELRAGETEVLRFER